MLLSRQNAAVTAPATVSAVAWEDEDVRVLLGSSDPTVLSTLRLAAEHYAALTGCALNRTG